MFFWFPFSFLIPIIFILFAVKIGTRIFREFFRDLDDTEGPYHWFPKRRSGSGLNLKNFKSKKPQDIEALIFRIAYKLKGRITISDIVLETGLNLKSAEETVNGMVDGIRVCMEVDERGLVVYEFPEIISRLEGS